MLSLILWIPAGPAWAQAPGEVISAYGEFPYGYNPQGPVQQVQLPGRPQYYEYLPPRQAWDDPVETPLDRFLKQSIRQTYGRVDYLNWSLSNPGEGVIGGPGKKLLDSEGFRKPAFIDPVRGPAFINYPIINPLLVNHPQALVLIQAWETNPRELPDADTNGNIFDVIDNVNNITGDPPGDGINDDDNDLDIFPRITNQAKSDMLLGLDTSIIFSSGDPTAVPVDPAQVAVLAVGQLANTNAFRLNNTNGFRGVMGLNTSFGALETTFLVMDKARSGYQYNPIAAGLIGVPGGAGVFRPADPQVLPVLVNGSMAPDVFDTDGNIVTDSNNYYIIFNDSYSVRYESEAWGVTPSVLLTMYERPNRFKFSSTFGFRYFDFREQMLQQGSFSNDDTVADFTYNNEVNADFTSTIDSHTLNRVYGPQAGIRAELGGERVKFGLDANLMLGANTHEAVVAVDDLLFVGDDNFTRQTATHFATGFDMLVDARVRLTENITFTVGYNMLWFNAITRPHENIYYNINATRIPAPAEGGPDWVVGNDVVVDKKKSSVSLSGLSLGLQFDW
ncbi:MAG: BBP7 family outer membrane beta-barrel protein [Planctomycetaceae bacterium]